jgi:putrescine:ornithine antiporter
LSEQFGALVNLAVVTNVIPYIISLSALMVIMKQSGVSPGVYKRNVAVLVVALLYSTYAIYASGMSAVLGATIVLAITYALYGFLATRFPSARVADAPARSA